MLVSIFVVVLFVAFFCCVSMNKDTLTPLHEESLMVMRARNLISILVDSQDTRDWMKEQGHGPEVLIGDENATWLADFLKKPENVKFNDLFNTHEPLNACESATTYGDRSVETHRAITNQKAHGTYQDDVYDGADARDESYSMKYCRVGKEILTNVFYVGSQKIEEKFLEVFYAVGTRPLMTKYRVLPEDIMTLSALIAEMPAKINAATDLKQVKEFAEMRTTYIKRNKAARALYKEFKQEMQARSPRIHNEKVGTTWVNYMVTKLADGRDVCVWSKSLLKDLSELEQAKIKAIFGRS